MKWNLMQRFRDFYEKMLTAFNFYNKRYNNILYFKFYFHNTVAHKSIRYFVSKIKFIFFTLDIEYQFYLYQIQLKKCIKSKVTSVV